MESKGSLACSQGPATSPYAKPVEPSPMPCVTFRNMLFFFYG